MVTNESAPSQGRTLGRFRLERQVGAGGMGVVYEATDLRHHSRVALKTLDHLEPEAIYRLKREFRTLAGVLHPNLVHMHELARDGDNWFFVMDYIEGKPLLEHLRAGEPRSERQQSATVDIIAPGFPTAAPSAAQPYRARREHWVGPDADFYHRVRLVLGGLISGVEALHELGKVHRDLKPSNVLVTDAGRVVILDFGLTSDERPEGTSKTEESPRGTPLYMAPELFLGAQPSRAADYYAIGVMLYEALVGRPPFSGHSHQLVSEKLYGEVAAPRDVVVGTPVDLNDACGALLCRRPEERPDATQLRRLLRLEDPTQVLTSSTPSERFRPSRSTFIGRKDELLALQTAYRRVGDDLAALITVCGESGLGKTALVDAFLEEVGHNPNTLVLSGRCYEHESVPYKAFDRIADQLSSHLATLPDEELPDLVPQDAPILVTLFPVLARVAAFRFAEDNAPADPTELRLRGLSGLRELLYRLARRTRLILVIDDLQWADSDSALVFKELFTAAQPPPLLALLTSREASPAALAPLFSVLDRRPQPLVHADLLALSPLTTQEAVMLAEQTSGVELRSKSIARFITEEAGGNPFFVLALSRHIDKTGQAPASLPSFMRSWLLSLPPPALDLLRLVAVSGRPIEEAVLAALRPTVELTELLFLLSQEHFIGAWPTPNRNLECYHDRIRDAVVATLGQDQLRALHGELADVLEAIDGADAETLATHFLAAGRYLKGVRYAEQAADEAAGALAFFHSAHWYRRALERTNAPDHRAALQIKLGEAFACAGQGVTGAKYLLLAAEHLRGSASLKIRQRAAELLLVCGHIDEGVKTLEAVLTHIRMNLAKTPRRALLSLITQRLRVKVRGLDFLSRSEREIPEEDLLRIDACWSVALGLSLVDPIRAADFQTRNLRLSLDSGDVRRIARALAMEAGFVAAGGSRAESRARKLSVQALSLAERIEDPHAIGLSTFTAGLGRYLVGDWPSAIAHFDRAETILLEVPGAIWELNAAQRFRVNAQVFTGDLLRIEKSVPDLLRSATERGNLYSECALRVRGDTLLLLMQDEPTMAEAETAEVMARWSQEGFQLQHYSALWSRCLCRMYRGEGAVAMNDLEQTWPKLKSSLLTNTQALRVESRHLRTRVCLTVLCHQPRNTQAEATLRADIQALRREHVGWGDAFASFAEALLMAGADQGRAMMGLVRAEQEFTSLSMNLFAQVCRYRRGQLLGGEEGSSLVTEARGWVRAQHVKDVDRFIEHCGPMTAAPARKLRRAPSDT